MKTLTEILDYIFFTIKIMVVTFGIITVVAIVSNTGKKQALEKMLQNNHEEMIRDSLL